MKRLTTFLMALLLTWIGAKAQIVSGTDYVIVNKEANQFLYGSYNWGCEASIGSKPVTFTVTESGDAYTLQANQWEGEHYVGADFYTDKSSSNAGSISITAVTDDEGYYYLSNASGAYLVGNGKNKYTTVTSDADLSSDAAKWKFVTEEEILAEMDDASSANPVDVSILISNPNFRPDGNGVTTVSNWTATDVTVGSYASNYVQANAAEAYSKEAFSISQTITLPRAGYYNLSAQGFYRNGSDGTGTNNVSAQMYFGEETVNLDARRTTANTMAAAWEVFLEGSEPVTSITYHATSTSEEGEEVEIGFTGAVPSASWAIFGELQLEYLGETLEYAIGEPECTTAYVQPGGELTITFPNCVTPNTNEEPELDTNKSITVNDTEVTDAVLTSTGLTSTVTFTVPTTLAQGAEVTVIVPAGLVTWSGTTVSSPSTDVTFTLHTPAIADQSGVYLYSTHAEAFLSRGGEHTTVGTDTEFQSYGKIATTDPYGIPVDITFGDDGLATVKFLDSNLFLYGGGWAWTDGSEANAGKYLVKEVTTEDEETIYQFCYDGGDDSFLYVNDENYEWVANNGNLTGDNNLNSEIERTYWQIFTMTERDANKATFVQSQKVAIAEAVGATDLDAYIASQPITDITFMVADAALAGSLTGWTETDYYSDNTGTYFSTGTWGTEIYQGDAKLSQTVSGLEEGIYKVTLQGFVRQGQASNIINNNLDDYDLSIGFIEANGYQTNIMPWAEDREKMSSETSYGDTYPSNTDQATACFSAGLYNNELYTYVDSEGTLELSINCPDVLGYGWMIFKNLTLTYYGELEDTDSDYHTGDVVTVDGYECTIVDENEISNHSFELGFDGWTKASDFTTTISEDFELRGGEEDLAKTGNKYLVGTSTSSVSGTAGSAGTSSLGTAWSIAPGKTYLFTYWIKKLDETEETEWLKTSLTNTPGTETEELGYPETVSSDWQKVQYLFTNGEEDAEDCYAYLQIKFRWLAAHWGFDNFSLHEVEAEELDYANDVTWALVNPSFETDKVANLTEDATRCTPDGGDYTGGAYTIGNGLTGWTLSVSSSSNVASDLMTEACQRTDNGFGAPGTPTDGTQMLYLHDNNTTTSYVEQTITLPAGEYKLTVDSKCVSTGGSTAVLVAKEGDAVIKSTALGIHSSYESGEDVLAWDNASLILSLDAETEVTVGVDISYTGNGSFLLDNFKLYSVDAIEEEITWTMTTAGWGTMILPFAASIPDGLILYAGDALTIDDSVITVATEATAIAANTAYLVKGDVEKDTEYTFKGTPTNKGEIHTTGYLTGTLVDLAVAKGAAFATDGTQYLLQNHEDEGLAFYPIIIATDESEDSSDATLDAYHCYLTLDNSTSPDGVRAFISLPGSDNEETGIVAVESETLANDAIYDLSGRRVSKAVKGVYIQNGKKVLVK